MLRIVLVCFLSATVSAGNAIYRVERQDFDTTRRRAEESPLSYQRSSTTSRNGVYKVSRQDFTSGNDGIPFLSNVHHEHTRLSDGYHGGYSSYQKPQDYGRPYYETTLMPKLFVPADESIVHYPSYSRRNYDSVVPMSHFGHWNEGNHNINDRNRVNTESRTVQPVPPASSIPGYTSTLSYDRGTGDIFASSEGDGSGILPAIASTWNEGEPLPPISSFSKPEQRRTLTQTNTGDENAIKYHSFNDFVEISDEHKELLEAFQVHDDDRDRSLSATSSTIPVLPPMRRRLRRRRCTSGNCEHKSLVMPIEDGVTLYESNSINRLYSTVRKIRVPVSIQLTDAEHLKNEMEIMPQVLNIVQVSLFESKPYVMFYDYAGWEEIVDTNDVAASNRLLINLFDKKRTTPVLEHVGGNVNALHTTEKDAFEKTDVVDTVDEENSTDRIRKSAVGDRNLTWSIVNYSSKTANVTPYSSSSLSLYKGFTVVSDQGELENYHRKTADTKQIIENVELANRFATKISHDDSVAHAASSSYELNETVNHINRDSATTRSFDIGDVTINPLVKLFDIRVNGSPSWTLLGHHFTSTPAMQPKNKKSN